MPATTFDRPMYPGTKFIKKTITVTNTSGSYSETFYDERITGALEADRLEIANPEVFDANPHITCYNGYFTFTCDDVEGTTTVKIYFLKVTDDPTAITSSEFDLLNNRITAIENVETRYNITIEPSDFSITAPYTYTWTNSNVKTNSSIKVEFCDTDVDESFITLGYEKVTGGIQFEADIIPEDDIQVTIHIMNAGGINAVEVTGEEVATSVISGAANVDEALGVLAEKLPQYSTDEKIVGSFNGHAIYEKTYFSDTTASSTSVLLDNRDFFKYENAYAIVSIEGAAKTGSGNIYPVNYNGDSTYYIRVSSTSAGLSLNTGGWRTSGYFITVRYIKT